MQISNTTQTTTYTQNTVNKTQTTNQASFASYLENSTTSEVEQETGSELISFLEEMGRFPTCSGEDEQLFREILQDDKLTMEEMDKLTYQQVQQLSDLVLPKNLSKDEFEKVGGIILMIGTNQIKDMFFATQYTNNTNFNNALYETAKEIDDDLSRMNILGEIRHNLSQAHFGEEINPSFSHPYAQNLWQEDIDNMKIDFDNFLNAVFTEYEGILNNPKAVKEAKEQTLELKAGYEILAKHYNTIKNQAYYA